jgi:hypothetical protein
MWWMVRTIFQKAQVNQKKTGLKLNHFELSCTAG